MTAKLKTFLQRRTSRMLAIFIFSLLFLIFAIGWFYFPTISMPLALILTAIFAITFGILFSRELESGLLVLILSLFFERLPTLEVSGFSLKLSFIVGAGLILAWIIKKMIQWRHSELACPVSSKMIFGDSESIQKRSIDVDSRLRGNDNEKDNNKSNIKYSIFNISLVIFWLINLISLIINPIAFRSIAIFLLITFNLILFFIISQMDLKNEVLTKIAKIFIIGSVVVCIFAFWQFFGDLAGIAYKWIFLREFYTKIVFGVPRVQGTFLEPLLFANFLLIPIFLNISLWLKKQVSNKFFVLTMILFISVFILTISRGAYLALLVSVILMAILAFKDIFKLQRLLILILITLISITISFSMIRFGGGKQALTNFFNQSSDAVKNPKDQGASTQQRLGSYEIALDAFKKQPFFGVGSGNFGRYYDQKTGIQSGQTQTVNNEYLELLTENGIFGLLAFLVFIISLIYLSFKTYFNENDNTKKAVIFGLSLAVLAFLIQYNFFSTLYLIYFWVVLGILTNLINHCHFEHSEKSY